MAEEVTQLECLGATGRGRSLPWRVGSTAVIFRMLNLKVDRDSRKKEMLIRIFQTVIPAPTVVSFRQIKGRWLFPFIFLVGLIL